MHTDPLSSGEGRGPRKGAGGEPQVQGSCCPNHLHELPTGGLIFLGTPSAGPRSGCPGSPGQSEDRMGSGRGRQEAGSPRGASPAGWCLSLCFV